METPEQSEKINPFKELPKPRQPQLEKEQKSQEKEITIKLKPWKLVKGLFVIIILVGVFYVGRFTAGGDSFDFSKYFSQDTGPSGLVTGDAKDVEEPNVVKEETPVEASLEQNQTDEAQLDKKEASTVDPDQTKPEKLVSEEYTKVTLSLDGVYKDWKGTWGKIKGIKYTITNNEEGTIKPHHFMMVVEGYEDGGKYFDVSYTSQRVKAGQTLSDEASVSGGFAYSPLSIPGGDLSQVRISLVLVDGDGDTITSVAQDVDLRGE